MRSLRFLARYRRVAARYRRAERTASQLSAELIAHDERCSDEHRTLFATIEALRAENTELRDELAIARAKANAGYPGIHGVVPPDTGSVSALRHQLLLSQRTLIVYEGRLAAYERRPTSQRDDHPTNRSSWPDACWTTDNEETPWTP